MGKEIFLKKKKSLVPRLTDVNHSRILANLGQIDVFLFLPDVVCLLKHSWSLIYIQNAVKQDLILEIAASR